MIGLEKLKEKPDLLDGGYRHYRRCPVKEHLSEFCRCVFCLLCGLHSVCWGGYGYVLEFRAVNDVKWNWTRHISITCPWRTCISQTWPVGPGRCGWSPQLMYPAPAVYSRASLFRSGSLGIIFDVIYQTGKTVFDLKLRRKPRNKVVKIYVKIRYPSAITVMISFVETWSIISEFEKALCILPYH